MRQPQSPSRAWGNYFVGILIESAYVLVLLGVAGLIAWAVSVR